MFSVIKLRVFMIPITLLCCLSVAKKLKEISVRQTETSLIISEGLEICNKNPFQYIHSHTRLVTTKILMNGKK
ncbi:CLUMA_CG004100, isoform A [Clunio marinus]|uniref:CLUMA_CG004100, isoform A n=1 Tax=Clunio marinus TaxID=568069 RepID=A0A1J1HQM5_9DIPT|nr:CLUMA_CG004100, isoform A [Clunio marinus]